MIGANKAFGQFVGHIIVFCGELPGNIEGNGLGSLPVDDFRPALRHLGECRSPVERCPVATAAVTPKRFTGPITAMTTEMQGAALAAELTKIGRMIGIAAYAGNLLTIMFDDDAAAGSAVRAN